MKKELGERKHLILRAVVEDFIKDASPITSNSVRSKHIQSISTATLRNELNALEAMGYLKQLHTSGGRVPTTNGYRYYVSSLLEDFDVSEQALNNVATEIEDRTTSLKDILTRIVDKVSKVTNYPTVMLANGYENLILEEIKIIPLIDGQALCLFKTLSGIVNNMIDVSASEKSCNDASKFLTKKFKGQTIGSLINGNILAQSLQEIETFKNIVDSLISSMQKFISTKMLDVRSINAGQLLNENEQESISQTKRILKLLNNEDELASRIEGDENDLTVTLGDESQDMQGCALIKAPIVIKGTKVANIAVIGPERMDYSAIASALKLVMNELENKKK